MFSIEKLKDFDNHTLASFIFDSKSKLRGFIAIHRGGLSRPAFGATRIWNYNSEIEALTEALKLSKLMTYKSALAGLKYGGAKAVIVSHAIANNEKKELLNSFVQRVNWLGGHFITGADVGIGDEDLKMMSSASPYIVGVKSDPVKYTALGVFYSIKVCLEEIFGKSAIRGRTFAIQGVGKTGLGLLKLLYAEAKQIYIADTDWDVLDSVKKRFPKVEIVKTTKIHKLDIDVFCPCALSNAINVKNVSKLQCKLIAGSANNQLQNSYIGEMLYKLGILYAPDYVVNAGGLIAVVDEYENKNKSENKDQASERLSKRVEKINQNLKLIIAESKKKKKATNLVADEMAEKISVGLYDQ